MAKSGQNLSIQDLRAMIHGLRMATFAFVDEIAQDQVRFLIAGLPSPERLGSVAENPKDFNQVVEQVGKVMQLVEAYAEKGSEFKARHLTKKKLPPRYKTLEWKKTEWFDKEKDLKVKETKVKKEEVGMQQAASINVVRSLIKASAVADQKGFVVLASKSLNLAKTANTKLCSNKELEVLAAEFKAAGLEKEAGWMSGIGNVFQGVKEQYQIGNLAGQVNKIVKSIDEALVYVKKIKSSDQYKKQQVADLTQRLNNMKMLSMEMSKVVWADKQTEDAKQDKTEPKGATGGEAKAGPTPTPTPTPTAAGGEVGANKAPFDVNKLSREDLQDLLMASASKPRIYKLASVDTSWISYIKKLKVEDPQAYQALFMQLQSKSKEIGNETAAPAAPAAPAAAPAAVASTTAPAEKPCPSCGNKQTGGNYCVQCGKKMQPAPQLAPSAAQGIAKNVVETTQEQPPLRTSNPKPNLTYSHE